MLFFLLLMLLLFDIFQIHWHLKYTIKSNEVLNWLAIKYNSINENENAEHISKFLEDNYAIIKQWTMQTRQVIVPSLIISLFIVIYSIFDTFNSNTLTPFLANFISITHAGVSTAFIVTVTRVITVIKITKNVNSQMMELDIKNKNNNESNKSNNQNIHR